MDIRDFIRQDPEHIFGHDLVEESMNLRDEIKKFTVNPLESFLGSLQKQESVLLDEVSRFRQSFEWYSLSLERVLRVISIARRAQQELKYHSKVVPYSKRRKTISMKYRESAKYMELDFQNLILHSCLMLNRSLVVSRSFFEEGEQPSFTSFSRHKDFLLKKEYSQQFLKEYKNYIVYNTSWFEIPLLVLRDKYLMHSSEEHMSFLGWPDNWNLVLSVLLPYGNEYKLNKAIVFNPRRLARDIQSHLVQIGNFTKKLPIKSL